MARFIQIAAWRLFRTMEDVKRGSVPLGLLWP